MNKQQFVQLLREPVGMSQDTVRELEDLANSKPYFQGAHTLLAKGSKQLNSKEAKRHITTAAVYATDRVLLKKFIDGQLIFLTRLDVHESHEGDLERDLAKTIKTNRVAAAKLKADSREAKRPPVKPEQRRPEPEKKIAPVAASVQKTNPTPPKSENSNLDNLIDEIYQDLEELKTNRAKLREIENRLTEDEAVENALKKATANVEKQTEEPTPDENPELEKNAEVKKLGDSRSARVSNATPIDADAPVKEESKKSGDKSAEKRPSKRKDRLVSKKVTKKRTPSDSKNKDDQAEKDSKEEPTAEKKKIVQEIEPDDKIESVDDTQEAIHEKVVEAKNEAPKSSDQDQIISDFIRANPTIPTPKRDAKKNQDDLSTGSTELHPDIASEYLAEIYKEQGNTKRAHQIYEALMVRFPEKSTYFAAIIKKLNETS